MESVWEIRAAHQPESGMSLKINDETAVWSWLRYNEVTRTDGVFV